MAPADVIGCGRGVLCIKPLSFLQYITFLGAQISGLLIISKIQSIIQNQLAKSADDAASVNSILGGVCTCDWFLAVTLWLQVAINKCICSLQVNVLGRLVLPPISDMIKARKLCTFCPVHVKTSA